jgi:membrane-associated phospholipid phosphatase
MRLAFPPYMVALRAHWPGDLLLSSLIGFLWAAFLIRFV